jgi:hypothetical protein
LDYLRLLYWVFYFPQALRWYVDTFGGGYITQEEINWRKKLQLLSQNRIQRQLLFQGVVLTIVTPLLLCVLLQRIGISIGWLGVVGGVASGVVGGVTLGVVGGVALGSDVGRGGRRGVGVAFGVVGGVVLGVVKGVALGVTLGVVGGVALRVTLGVVGGVVFGMVSDVVLSMLSVMLGHGVR